MAKMTQNDYDELRRDVSEVWLRDNVVGRLFKKLLGYHADAAGLKVDDEHEGAIRQEEQHRITTVPAVVSAESAETQEIEPQDAKTDNKQQVQAPAKEK